MTNDDLMIDAECAVELPSGPGVRMNDEWRITIWWLMTNVR